MERRGCLERVRGKRGVVRKCLAGDVMGWGSDFSLDISMGGFFSGREWREKMYAFVGSGDLG